MIKHKNYELELSLKPNRSVLIWGTAGFGKSFCCYRIVESEYWMHRKILILDYSGSYNEYEIAKAGLNIPYVSWNPYHTPFFWRVCVESETEFISKLTDIFLTIMNITSYIQRKLLLEALETQVKQQHLFNFKNFYQTLENLYSCKETSDKSTDELTNLERLLTRFFPYRELDSIHIKPGKTTDKASTSRLCILQLSEYSEQLRKFLTLMFSELLWLESKNRKSPHRFDTILFDEFQFLPVKTGSALALFLREGRKLGVGLILSTQYISCYSQDEMEVLLQAGNLLVFHPNDRDLKFSAKILDHEHPHLWTPLLKKLEIGQAILKGNYTIKNHNQVLHDPVICNITTAGGETSV